MKKFYAFLLFLTLGTMASAQVETSVPQASGEEEVFVVVENMPEFPGWMEAMYRYISTNLKYPEKAKAEKVTGMVFLSFVIEKDGSVSSIQALRCPDETLCEEAVRVVKAMPKWKPGRDMKGNKVRVQYNLPINFSLN